MSDGREAIFIQHAESYRYQDALKWSRVKTAAVVEGAILYGVWGTGVPDNVKRLALVFGILLVFILCILALLDRSYARMHLNMMKEYQESEGCPCTHARFVGMGTALFVLSLVLLNLFNVYMLCTKFGTDA